ncbi:dihydrodipicolinate synthase family protein [Novipirellula sp.]|uniref:dihydrodipicolinate synthase family protein n=1 Tax=Novipirellula sp. TaxID=2795430 RepID=UPI00356A7923
MSQLTRPNIDEIPAIRPRRTISGMSAILLPLLSGTKIDWEGFRGHVTRTADAGLVPAVNMDTGYANLISESQREQVLAETQNLMDGQPYVAGVFVKDDPDAAFDFDAYRTGLDQILKYGGTPIIFQSYGLTEQADDDIVEAYAKIGSHAGDFLGFELGKMFAPFGKIYSLDVYKGLMGIETCRGAKHSSLSRELEWQRLRLRDETRPDFKVLTGNDLAIDMVMYGSDYLLGLSTFAPEAFARRDAMWATGDAGFYELNDILQYLGFLAFRDPVPAYKHNAAQFLHARGWIKTPLTYPGSPERPESDVAILQNILDRISE